MSVRRDAGPDGLFGNCAFHKPRRSLVTVAVSIIIIVAWIVPWFFELSATAARWGTEIPRATHSGDLRIGDLTIPCAALENGTRVLTEHGITNALLGSRSGASKRLKRASVEQVSQRLTEDVGHPKLREHLAAVVMVMKLSLDWNSFMRSLNQHMPKYADMPLFDELPAIEAVTPAVQVATTTQEDQTGGAAV